MFDSIEEFEQRIRDATSEEEVMEALYQWKGKRKHIFRALAGSDVPFVASLGVGAHLESWGIEPNRITELDWWERTEPAGGLSITATPAQHFSGRTPGSRNHTLWASYVIEAAGHTAYFGADSGMMPGFAAIGDRFGPFEMVCLEIGAYHPAWGDIHLGPGNALAGLDALGGGPLLPIHWGTFDLATHRWDQPIEVLTAGAEKSGARLLTTLAWELRRRGGGWGLATMCIGVGQGIAVVLGA